MSTPAPTPHPFSQYVDLLSERIGGTALLANDDFFAPKENLVKAAAPIFIADKFTPKGKWMDGWETRRRRTPGHDWCVLQLGSAGKLRCVNINTAFFVGNYPEFAQVEAAFSSKALLEKNALSALKWTEVLPKTPLAGGADNFFKISSEEKWTHVRLNIFPDGGVARLRLFGEVIPDWKKLAPQKKPIDLASILSGGTVVTCNDMFFGPKDNLILPGRAANMGDGWETRRKRVPGNDWIVIRLGKTARVSKIEVDTNHFKGNFPESCSLEYLTHPMRDLSAEDFQRRTDFNWQELLPRTKLKAHHRHFFASELSKNENCDYLRLNIFPDGGVSRLRVYGDPQ